MVEYITLFLVLMIASIAFYMAYDRFFRRERKSNADLYLEALTDLLDNKPESAFTKLRQVVAVDADNIDAYMRLGQILREHNKPDRALQVHKDLTLRTGLAREEKEAILRHLYYDYYDLKEPDTAEAALAELIELDSSNHWALTKLFHLQQETGKWNEAYETANKLLKLESSRSKRPLAQLKYRMGLELYEKKEYHKARVLFKEALGLDPEAASAYLRIGDSYYEEKRYEDAVGFWKKMIAAVPQEGYRAIERLEKTLFDLGRFGDIPDICESILAHKPDDILARLTLAEFHKKKGDLERAEETLKRVVGDNPEEIGPVMELILIHLEQKKYDKIEALIRQFGQKKDESVTSKRDGIVDTSLIGIN